MKTQNQTINLGNEMDFVTKFREMLSRKCETFSAALGCSMSVGQAAGIVLASVPTAAALFLASAELYGWAACCALLAANLAAPGVIQFAKEGGEA